MAYPFTAFPTLGDFITRAQAQGCKLRYLTGTVHGPKGPVTVRYLQSPSGVVQPLPDMADDERLGPTELGSLCRTLDIKGYEHCFP
jgi:hypothetical protein